MHIVDYSVILIYMCLMVLIGIRCRNSSINISDYIRMGNKSTWWMAGFSIFMATFSAATFTGIAGQGFIAGFSVTLVQFFGAMTFFFQAAFMAGMLRRTRAITPMDAVRSRFGPAAEQVKAYVSSFSSFFFGGFFLLGFGTFASGLLGIPLWIIVIGIGIVVVFYSVAGGTWSVQITDSLQAMILIPITIAFSILCLSKVGWFPGLFAGIEAAGLSRDFALLKPDDYTYSIDLPIRRGNFTPLWAAASVFSAIMAAVNLQTCHRYLSLRDEKDARKAATLAGVLTLLGCLIWFIPVYVGRLMFEAEIASVQGIPNPADAAYAITAMKLLPPGLLGMIFVCMLSATMSSMDGFLTGTAGFMVRNMFQPLRRALGYKDPSDRGLLTLTKLVNLTLGLWAIVMAFVLNRIGGDTGMFQVMQTLLTLIGAPSSIPFALALFVRRIPLWGLFSGIICGVLTSITFFVLREKGITIQWGYEVFIMSATCLLPTIISTFFWKHTNQNFRDHVDRFFTLIRTPVDADTEVGVHVNSDLLKVVGTYALSVGGMLLLLIFWCRDRAEVITLLGICTFILSLGSFMFYKSRQLER